MAVIELKFKNEENAKFLKNRIEEVLNGSDFDGRIRFKNESYEAILTKYFVYIFNDDIVVDIPIFKIAKIDVAENTLVIYLK